MGRENELGGAKTKFKNNISAIRTLHKLRDEHRIYYATAEEQTTLIKYVGWGGIPQAFDPENHDWRREYDELKSLLRPHEFEAARRSTQDAHYTSTDVIEGIYNGLERLGFKGGHILEPSVGIGKFIALMPDAMMEKSRFHAIEMDKVSHDITRSLFPIEDKVSLELNGFQISQIREGTFDAVVGNPPFGSQKIYDPQLPFASNASIHNYFVLKCMNTMREGGVMGIVISHHFLDAHVDDKRKLIAEKMHFLGAIRLPNTAFKTNALTEVTTDIIFLQKARKHEQPNQDWLSVINISRDEENPIYVNEYFARNPEMMLGRMTLEGTMYASNTPTLQPIEGVSLKDQLSDAIQKLPENVYFEREKPLEEKPRPNINVPEGVKINSLFVDEENNKIARRLENDLGKPVAEWLELSDTQMERVAGMIKIREIMRRLMNAERTEFGDESENMRQLRKALNSEYDSFVAKYGYLNNQTNDRLLSGDPERYMLQALERNFDKGISVTTAKKHGVPPREPSAEKKDIFFKRLVAPIREITHCNDSKEALLVSMNELGRVSFKRMIELTDKPREQIELDLQGLIYHNPNSQKWETAEIYLGGNVKQKLEKAKEAADTNIRYQINVDALRRVQPADIEPEDISVQLGASWVPPKAIEGFAKHLFGEQCEANIDYQPSIGKWFCKISRVDNTTNYATLGTDRMAGTTIIEHLLTNTQIQVKDKIGEKDGKPIFKLNEEQTAAAQQKAEEIKQKFADWIWDDKDRRVLLAKIYNDKFNTNIPTIYKGDHLQLRGSSELIQFRTHQKNAVWRGIQDGTALFDHEVGAGKTFVCIATAMEGKRIGLHKKPMFVVPNHLLMQWRDSFYALYPEANILVAGKEDFAKENRQKLFANIATADWDAVVVAHSSFKKIAMPEAEFQDFLKEQIDDMTSAIYEMKRNKGERLTIKEMEKARARMENKLKERTDTGKKDSFGDFEDLGVDALFVDEAHEFKNLFFTTSLTKVAGLGNRDGSEKAMDMFVKVRSIQKKHEGRGIYFATGTPISNTIAEVYTVQRYMQYDEMKRRGIHHFDSWASTFGNINSSWELDATGVNYKLNSRFSKFQNVPELVSMYRIFADVITKQDLMQQAIEAGKRFPIPKIKGGKPKVVVVERSEAQALYQGIQLDKKDAEGNTVHTPEGDTIRVWNEGSIVWRMENMPKDPSLDNPLKVTNDARLAALDFRIIDPLSEDFAGSKINRVVEDTFNTWAEWKEDRGTQLIFCDLSTPKGSFSHIPDVTDEAADEKDLQDKAIDAISMDEVLSKNVKFSVYDNIKQKLINKGIPEHEIRFIHEAKTDLQKQKLFDQVNRGEVRVLMGTTAKMGAGMNVQQRLVAMRDIDCPWRPSDIEQRMGRILRQGNLFYERDPDGFEVELARYSTVRTYDARMWQTIETKARSIDQFRRGDSAIRVIDDVAGQAATAAEMKAEATGNPLILVQVQLQAELKKYEALFSSYRKTHYALENKVAHLMGANERYDARNDLIRQDIERTASKQEHWEFKSEDGKTFTKDNSEVLAKYLLGRIKDSIAVKIFGSKTEERIGIFRGFEVMITSSPLNSQGEQKIQFGLKGVQLHTPGNLSYGLKDEFSASGFIQRLDNYINSLPQQIEANEKNRFADYQALKVAKSELEKGFPYQTQLDLIRKDVADVMMELRQSQGKIDYRTNWRPQSGDYSDVFWMADSRASIKVDTSVSLEDMGLYKDVTAQRERMEEEYLQMRRGIHPSQQSVPASQSESESPVLMGMDRIEMLAKKNVPKEQFIQWAFGVAVMSSKEQQEEIAQRINFVNSAMDKEKSIEIYNQKLGEYFQSMAPERKRIQRENKILADEGSKLLTEMRAQISVNRILQQAEIAAEEMQKRIDKHDSEKQAPATKWDEKRIYDLIEKCRKAGRSEEFQQRVFLQAQKMMPNLKSPFETPPEKKSITDFIQVIDVGKASEVTPEKIVSKLKR